MARPPKYPPKGMAPPILSDGMARSAPPPRPRGRQQGALSPGAALRTNLGGSVPPQKPKARQTPRPSRQMAIGERPVLAKTKAKMKGMGY